MKINVDFSVNIILESQKIKKYLLNATTEAVVMI